MGGGKSSNTFQTSNTYFSAKINDIHDEYDHTVVKLCLDNYISISREYVEWSEFELHFYNYVKYNGEV